MTDPTPGSPREHAHIAELLDDLEEADAAWLVVMDAELEAGADPEPLLREIKTRRSMLAALALIRLSWPDASLEMLMPPPRRKRMTDAPYWWEFPIDARDQSIRVRVGFDDGRFGEVIVTDKLEASWAWQRQPRDLQAPTSWRTKTSTRRS